MRIDPSFNESPPMPASAPIRALACRRSWRSACRLLVLPAVLLATPLCGQLEASDADAQTAASPTLQEIIAARDDGQVRAAFEMLIRFDEQSDSDLSVDFVLMARAGKGFLEPAETDELFSRAIRSLGRSRPTPETHEQRLLIRTLAANHFAGRSASRRAATILISAFEELSADHSQVSLNRGRSLVKLAMSTAWTELNSQSHEIAEQLYSFLVDFSARDPWRQIVGSDRSLAMLGLGWAMALQSGKAGRAADRLQQFIDEFPTHGDAPRAIAMRIQCLQGAEEHESAASEKVLFLDRWPESPFAQQIVLDSLRKIQSRQAKRLPSESEVLAVERWLEKDSAAEQWSVELVGRALSFAAPKLSPSRFDTLVDQLASRDQTGQWTAMVLNDCTQSAEGAVAEQIAANLIAGGREDASKMARESACRWAGRSGRWTMLALAAESVDLSVPDSTRSPHVDRLFAEALMQTRQGADALRWWSHLVDERGATDFATLLRCAESSVAYAGIDEAERRLERVSRALAETEEREDGIQEALINLLKADLAVRKVDFPQARSLFEQVVRSPLTTAELRGRAQWMIGETYYLQQDFAGAIEAYRQVEGLDPGGPFVAASLVQAGKSFEQLGRTREAGVCYGTLLDRFADSSYCREASRRMAALPEKSNANTGHGLNPSPGSGSADSPRMRR
jgi:tetratricopeptide (TPR) repeat protein